MCKFKFRFLIAFLTFGVGVLVIGILPTLQNHHETSSVQLQLNQNPQENIDLIADETPDDIKQKTYLSCPDNQTQFTFQGVSFDCNSQIGSKIEVTEFSKSPLLDDSDKPGYVHPSYLSFKFKNEEGKQESETDYVSEISVYPIEEYSQMYSISEHYRQYFDKEVNSLKELLSKRSAHLKGHNSFLGATDGQFGFKSQLKYISFKNGKGVGFVTQVQIEVTIINNEELVWAFEGITNDGKYYVRAIFPIRASFLPEKATDDFEDYSLSDYSRLSKRNEQYLSLIRKRLDSLPSNQYQPSLENLTDIEVVKKKWNENCYGFLHFLILIPIQTLMDFCSPNLNVI
jgi:hypothetical protein